MVTAKLDTIETLSLKERNGGIYFLQRRILVEYLTDTDYGSLFDAINATGVPNYGDSVTEASNLMVTNKEAKMLDSTLAEVIVTYEPKDQIQRFAETSKANLRASLNQLPTNKDKDGDTTFVEHEFPGDDPDPLFAGLTKTQGGQWDKFSPQVALHFEGTQQVSDIVGLALSVMNKTNDATWMGGGAGTWMCTGVEADVNNSGLSPIDYLLKLEFQYNPDGWDPTIVYVDPRTGRPPVDLVPDTGFKVVAAYDRIDFDTTFGITFGS